MATPKGTTPWNKGRGEGWTDARGYRWRYVTENGKQRQIREHRWVMQQHLGRRLEPWEQVHHIDGNTSNNSIENLQLTEATEHTLLHHVGSKRKYETKETVALFARMRAEIADLREINAEMYEALNQARNLIEELVAQANLCMHHCGVSERGQEWTRNEMRNYGKHLIAPISAALAKAEGLTP